MMNMIFTICLIITYLVGIYQIMVGAACKLVMLVKASRNWSQKIVSYFAMSLVMALTE